jgi:hypothetical protein
MPMCPLSHNWSDNNIHGMLVVALVDTTPWDENEVIKSSMIWLLHPMVLLPLTFPIKKRRSRAAQSLTNYWSERKWVVQSFSHIRYATPCTHYLGLGSIRIYDDGLGRNITSLTKTLCNTPLTWLAESPSDALWHDNIWCSHFCFASSHVWHFSMQSPSLYEIRN